MLRCCCGPGKRAQHAQYCAAGFNITVPGSAYSPGGPTEIPQVGRWLHTCTSPDQEREMTLALPLQLYYVAGEAVLCNLQAGRG